jgi:hypothetical protein
MMLAGNAHQPLGRKETFTGASLQARPMARSASEDFAQRCRARRIKRFVLPNDDLGQARGVIGAVMPLGHRRLTLYPASPVILLASR